MRELTRTRKQLTREKASHVQRIDKLLQAANLKLGSVLSDIMGQSGRVVLDASYHNALFHRLKARRGPKKAIVAVAASMLTAIHVMLQRSAAYRDLGADHFERAHKHRLAHRLTKKLQQLGFDVVLTPRASTTVPC